MPVRQFALTLAFCLLAAGCKRESELPPEVLEAEALGQGDAAISHTATLRGSERILLAGLVLELDAVSPDMPVRVTLRSTRGSDDAAIVLSGVSEAGDGRPAPRDYDVLGPGGTWMGPTDGIRTRAWRYQADRARIRVEAMSDTEARGTIDGTFYRFARQDPLGAPAQPETISGAFVARLLK